MCTHMDKKDGDSLRVLHCKSVVNYLPFLKRCYVVVEVHTPSIYKCVILHRLTSGCHSFK